jgi:hypothetical protein
MPLDEAIRKRGFSRWYERQLYEGHAHLVTGFLSLIMMAIALEMIEFRGSAAGLVALAAIAVAGCGLCVFTWRRFTLLLFRAEHLAERATCARCRVYARFDVVAAKEAPASPAGCALDVRCRKCGHAWTID